MNVLGVWVVSVKRRAGDAFVDEHFFGETSIRVGKVEVDVRGREYAVGVGIEVFVGHKKNCTVSFDALNPGYLAVYVWVYSGFAL